MFPRIPITNPLRRATFYVPQMSRDASEFLGSLLTKSNETLVRERRLISRSHSPYCQATGPIVQEGFVKSRIQDLQEVYDQSWVTPRSHSPMDPCPDRGGPEESEHCCSSRSREMSGSTTDLYSRSAESLADNLAKQAQYGKANVHRRNHHSHRTSGESDTTRTQRRQGVMQYNRQESLAKEHSRPASDARSSENSAWHAGSQLQAQEHKSRLRPWLVGRQLASEVDHSGHSLTQSLEDPFLDKQRQYHSVRHSNSSQSPQSTASDVTKRLDHGKGRWNTVNNAPRSDSSPNSSKNKSRGARSTVKDAVERLNRKEGYHTVRNESASDTFLGKPRNKVGGLRGHCSYSRLLSPIDPSSVSSETIIKPIDPTLSDGSPSFQQSRQRKYSSKHKTRKHEELNTNINSLQANPDTRLDLHTRIPSSSSTNLLRARTIHDPTATSNYDVEIHKVNAEPGPKFRGQTPFSQRSIQKAKIVRKAVEKLDKYVERSKNSADSGVKSQNQTLSSFRDVPTTENVNDPISTLANNADTPKVNADLSLGLYSQDLSSAKDTHKTKIINDLVETPDNDVEIPQTTADSRLGLHSRNLTGTVDNDVETPQTNADLKPASCSQNPLSLKKTPRTRNNDDSIDTPNRNFEILGSIADSELGLHGEDPSSLTNIKDEGIVLDPVDTPDNVRDSKANVNPRPELHDRDLSSSKDIPNDEAVLVPVKTLDSLNGLETTDRSESSLHSQTSPSLTNSLSTQTILGDLSQARHSSSLADDGRLEDGGESGSQEEPRIGPVSELDKTAAAPIQDRLRHLSPDEGSFRRDRQPSVSSTDTSSVQSDGISPDIRRKWRWWKLALMGDQPSSSSCPSTTQNLSGRSISVGSNDSRTSLVKNYPSEYLTDARAEDRAIEGKLPSVENSGPEDTAIRHTPQSLRDDVPKDAIIDEPSQTIQENVLKDTVIECLSKYFTNTDANDTFMEHVLRYFKPDDPKVTVTEPTSQPVKNDASQDPILERTLPALKNDVSKATNVMGHESRHLNDELTKDKAIGDEVPSWQQNETTKGMITKDVPLSSSSQGDKGENVKHVHVDDATLPSKHDRSPGSSTTKTPVPSHSPSAPIGLGPSSTRNGAPSADGPDLSWEKEGAFLDLNVASSSSSTSSPIPSLPEENVNGAVAVAVGQGTDQKKKKMTRRGLRRVRIVIDLQTVVDALVVVRVDKKEGLVLGA